MLAYCRFHICTRFLKGQAFAFLGSSGSKCKAGGATALVSKVIAQQDCLLNLRLLEEIEATTFAAKQTELRDRAAILKVQIDATDRSHDENADIAVKAFELPHNVRAKWVTADFAAKRRILEIVYLNLRLDDVTLYPTMRKPFDVLTERLISAESRGERI